MTKEYESIVYIGRFQPPHLAHIQIIRKALERAKSVIVLVGSADKPRTIKNPFTWEERAHMIYASFPGMEGLIQIHPLKDKMYNDQAWARDVQDKVRRATGGSDSVALIGHSKDESSYYLKMFPQWDLIDIDDIEDIHATDVRNALFTSHHEGEFDLKIGRNLPSGIHDWLRAFMLTTEYEQLVREYEFINKYKEAWESAPYPPTFVTVDAVVIQSGHVLLVRRRAEPGKGLWAIPGGFVNQKERIEDAAIRELREETKLKVPAPVLKGSIKERKVFDHPDRSLRGRTITHAHLIELPPGELPKVKGGDDADKARWVPLSAFAQMESQMFEDHFAIIQDLVGGV